MDLRTMLQKTKLRINKKWERLFPSARPSSGPDKVKNVAFGKYLFPMCEKELSEAQEKYERRVPGFQEGSFPETKPRHLDAPRYRLCTDNVYRSSCTPGDGIATILLTGDLMCNRSQQRCALTEDKEFHFTDGFAFVRELFAGADLVAGNLECTLSESASITMEEPRIADLPHCNAPPSYLDALRFAGYDLLVTANNHCMDAGLRGLFQTICHLDQYGFLHTGTFLRKGEKRFLLVEVDGIRVAFLSYTTKFNGKHKNLSPAGRKIFLNAYSQDRLARDISRAKAQGAEYIIAYNHWGTEYTNEITERQAQWAQEMADSGVDYIAGSHPHALQPYDVLTAADGRTVPVIYSLGNFISSMPKSISKETIILQLKLARRENGEVYLLEDGMIPCFTHKDFGGKKFTTVPVTSPYCPEEGSKFFAGAYENITATIGSKLRVLGKLTDKKN